MKIPYLMIRDYVQTSLGPEQLGDLLTMAGFELEGIEEVNGDHVLDIKVCSNRGDGLSALGLAREILAKDETAQPTDLYNFAGAGFPLPDDDEEGSGVAIKIDSPACDRFCARSFIGNFKLPTPARIATRLTQAGMRPISLLVDLSNYIMLEVGQPTHAYDAKTLKGETLIARQSNPGETLVTLDGVERKLESHMLVIADAERVVGIAGVMGGLETEVTEGTDSVILEAAHFVNDSVRKTRRDLNMKSEASYRFERSVDPSLPLVALNRFAHLLAEVDGGTSVQPGRIDVQGQLPIFPTLPLSLERANMLLGMEITSEQAQKYLERLGFVVGGSGGNFQVQVPSWRFDVTCEEDLIEDLGRVHGYEKIPERLPQGSTLVGGPKGFEAFLDKLREACLRIGLTQTMSHALRGLLALDDAMPAVKLRNPVPEMEYLRSSVLPCLASNAVRNGGKDLALFELARVFGLVDSRLIERYELGIMQVGALTAQHFTSGKGMTNASFFSIKGVVEQLLEAVGVDAYFVHGEDPRFHPGRCAKVVADGVTLGFVGQIHPSVAAKEDVSAETCMAVLWPQEVYAHANHEAKLAPISRNPAVRRDISVLIDEAVPYEKVEGAIKGATDVLEKVWLFDRYVGQGIPEGKHSLSFALQLRKVGENLTDEQANQEREKIVAALADLGGSLR